MTTDEAEYREKIRDDDMIADRIARERAENPPPFKEPCAMESAWLEFEKLNLPLDPQTVFYQGWIACGFHYLDKINKATGTDALKTD